MEGKRWMWSKIFLVVLALGAVAACGGGGGGGGSNSAPPTTSIKASPEQFRMIQVGDQQVFEVEIISQIIDGASQQEVARGEESTTLDVEYFSSNADVGQFVPLLERLGFGNGTVSASIIYQDGNGNLHNAYSEGGDLYYNTDAEVPGQILFPSPLQPGTSLQNNFVLIELGPGDISAAGDRLITIEQKELVDVGIGRIEAFPVTIIENFQQNRVFVEPTLETTVYWIHPRIGVVKFSSVLETDSILSLERTTVEASLVSVNYSIPAPTADM